MDSLDLYTLDNSRPSTTEIFQEYLDISSSRSGIAHRCSRLDGRPDLRLVLRHYTVQDAPLGSIRGESDRLQSSLAVVFFSSCFRTDPWPSAGVVTTATRDRFVPEDATHILMHYGRWNRECGSFPRFSRLVRPILSRWDWSCGRPGHVCSWAFHMGRMGGKHARGGCWSSFNNAL